MADKAKHAFGALERVDEAISSGKVDAFDILFVKDKNGKPYVGWVDKEGQKVICDDSAELAELESQLESEIATKADAEEVAAELATKANAEEVEAKITESIATAKTYTDGKVEAAVEAAVNEHLIKKYEIASLPDGALVNYREDEIRIMCKLDTVFTKQDVGETGDPDCYYATLKTYAFDDSIVGYREYMGNQVDTETLTDLKTDEYGRRYQPTWLALAKYDSTTNSWNYYGKSSNEEKFIGWDYRIDWYDANGAVVASDSIRINLANEDCYFASKPYYVNNAIKTAKEYTDMQIENAIENAIEIIEF